MLNEIEKNTVITLIKSLLIILLASNWRGVDMSA